MKFVVLCSSRGTAFQSVIDSMQNGSLAAKCLGLVADKEERGCVEKARQANIPVKIVPRRQGLSREEYDRLVDQAIRSFGDPDIIACIGWMFLLSAWFVTRWRNRILNVHPALLPKHPGAHAHDLVLKSGDKISGMTIHFIDEGMDTGPVILQKECPVLPDDTVDTLKARVQRLECEWYPKILQLIEEGSIKIGDLARPERAR